MLFSENDRFGSLQYNIGLVCVVLHVVLSLKPIPLTSLPAITKPLTRVVRLALCLRTS